MPSIPEFNAPALDIRPSEIGVESTAAAGRRLGVYGSQIAESDVSTGRAIAGGVKSVGDAAEQYAAHQNISSLARHGADVMASGTQSLNAYFSGADIPDDPNNPGAKKAALDERLNNPAAARQWLDSTLEPMLESYQQGAWTEGGQQYAQRFAENLRTHLTTSAIADQSTGAGIAAKDNLQKTADGYATAAFNSPNLHDVSGSLAAFDHAVGALSTSSPTINADGQARIKEWAEQEKAKIITSAVQGAIVSGRSYDNITKAFPQYVNPGQNYQFEKMAQSYRRGEENAAKQQILLDHALAEDGAHKYMNDAYSKYVHTDPDTGKVTVDPQYAVEVGKIPTMFRNAPNAVLEAERQQAWVTREQKPETDARISRQTYVGLLRDMRSQDTDNLDTQKKLLDQAWAARLKDPGAPGSMTEADFTSYRSEIEAYKTPEGKALADQRNHMMKNFEIMIGAGSTGAHPENTANMGLAEQAVRDKEAQVRQKGENPLTVYDPHSPNYFFTPQNIDKYKMPLAQLLNQAQAPQRLPEGYPPDAQWDSRGFWTVRVNGKLQKLSPAQQPLPTVPVFPANTPAPPLR